MQILKTLSLTKQTLLNDHWEIPLIFRQKYIPSIDGLRAVSIIFVLIAHLKDTKDAPLWLKWAGENIFFGEFGVQIFFVISGFLITGLLLKEKLEKGSVSLKGFYWRRIVRIFPVFYLYLIVTFIVCKNYKLPVTDEMFIGAALFSQNFAFAGGTWVLGHLWSLAVEEQFYLLWPLALYCLQRKFVYLILGIVLLYPLIQVILYFEPDVKRALLAPFLLYAPALMVGALLSVILFAGIEAPSWIKNLRHNPLLFIFGAWLIHFLLTRGGLGFFLIPFGYIISSALITFFLFRVVTKQSSRFLVSKPLIYLGRISYSLYIWQQIWMIPEGSYEYADLWWTAFPINIIGAIITAVISYHLFEKPLLRFKHIRKREQHRDLKVETVSST